MADNTNRRVLEVINFLTARPLESFTLSEIAAQLSMSNGSAHRVLKTLTQEGYLTCHPKHKTYSLGLVLISVGQAALARHPLISIAQREMEVLSARLGVQTIASALTGDELLFIAKAGSPATPQGVARVGQRRPFMPPLGLAHLAWASAEQQAQYFSRWSDNLSAGQQATLQQALLIIRERGYSMSVQGNGLAEITRQLSDNASDDRPPAFWQSMAAALGRLDSDEIQLPRLDALGEQRLSHLSAPVFDSEGRVVLEVSITGLAALSPEDIRLFCEQLLATTAAITTDSYGRF